MSRQCFLLPPTYMTKKEIIKIIIDNTEYWQPHGKKNSCFVIEEEEPFFWRINPKWANDTAEKIMKLYESKTIRTN